MVCTITQTIVHAAHVVQRNVLTSHSLLCAGRHSWSHVRAPCPNIGGSSVSRRPVQLTKGKAFCFEQPSLPVSYNWQHLGHIAQPRGEEHMAKMMKTAERALHKRTNKMLTSATKRYKKFMRQAAKAASDYKREEYLAAALSALVVTGVVASKLMANLEGKRAAVPDPSRKKRKTKAK